MQADFSVELGADDPTLEFPWSSPDGRHRYFDLKNHPDLLKSVLEAAAQPALREFLASLNSRASCLQTVKCDAWFTRDLNEEELIYGAPAKFGSYVDVIFAAGEPRFSFPQHEDFAQRLAALLKKAPEIPAAVEFIIRRCYFHLDAEPRDGFYLTCYCFGYGEDESDSRKRWTIALKLVENAVLQLSAQFRTGMIGSKLPL